MSAQQQIHNWFSTFEHKFEKQVPVIIADTALNFYRERFTKQEWNGTPWEKPQEKYLAKKTNKRTLYETGKLQNSLRVSESSSNRITISAGGSKAPYARVHNEGLRVRGVRYVRGYHNSNFMGKGKRLQIQPHSRKVDFKMPKRQFMGHASRLNVTLRNRLTLAFNK